MNQIQAYKKAGGRAKTRSAQDNAASVMLRNAKTKAFYNSLMNEGISEAIMTKEQALTRLTRTASVTIKDVCDFKNLQVGEDENGPVYQTVWTVKNAEDIPDHIAACIKSVSVTREGPKLELYDSNASIKQLSDMLGWAIPKKPTIPTIEFNFEPGATPAQQASQILEETSKGKISPDVAQLFINSIASMMKIEEVTEISERLEEMERMMGLTDG